MPESPKLSLRTNFPQERATMAELQNIWVEEIEAVGPHPTEPGLYQVRTKAGQVQGAALVHLTLTLENAAASKLLELMKGQPPGPVGR
jgi:hypothetical protein